MSQVKNCMQCSLSGCISWSCNSSARCSRMTSCFRVARLRLVSRCLSKSSTLCQAHNIQYGSVTSPTTGDFLAHTNFINFAGRRSFRTHTPSCPIIRSSRGCGHPDQSGRCWNRLGLNSAVDREGIFFIDVSRKPTEHHRCPMC